MATREEDLAHKKKSVRAAHKSSATRLMNQADALLEALDADELVLLSFTAMIKTLGSLECRVS